MRKRKYLTIVALAIVSVLVGSLFYSNHVSGASSSSSGSWGLIRFFTANETISFGSWETAATFTWVPNNSTDNFILVFTLAAEFSTTANYAQLFKIEIDGWSGAISDTYGINVWKYRQWALEPDIHNRPEYTIKLKLQGGNPNPNVGFSARNINIFLTVADGMVPNEYHKVELPSEGVGGSWIPVDRLVLLAPYVGLALATILATATAIVFFKYRRKQ